MDKSEVRAIAAELGLVNADKPDSQDICFVPEGRYTDHRQSPAARCGAARRYRGSAGRGAGPP